MKVTMLYGKTGLPLELPDEWRVAVIGKKQMPVLDDPPGAVRAALGHPVAARPLSEEARGARTACILICDITRPVPNGLLLRPVIERLMAAGVPAGGITVLVATGLHRPNEGPELRELVGDPWVFEHVAVENHFARNDADHVEIGVTRRGTPVRLDRRFVTADVRIATGLVEPHFMAGYSGGRKVITPGVAHAETITAIHTAKFLEHPAAANCVLCGNPLHEEQLEIRGMVGRVLSVNVVLDEHRRLSFVNYGEVGESHMEAVAFMRRYAEVPVPEKFPTVVTSSAGYPLDKTYYQTVKGMVGAMEILAPGGSLFIVSECSEGLGSPEYVEAQRRLIALGPDGFLADILPRGRARIDEWQTEMQLKPMRIGAIRLFSSLSEADSALTGVRRVTDLGEAIRGSVAASQDPRVAVIPEGPYVVPRFVPEERL